MKYHKLVRDKIPEILKGKGKKVVVRKLNAQEYSVFLEKKLKEEVDEFFESHELTELVDIQEVVLALAKNMGIAEKDLRVIRIKKFRERGGFRKRIFLKEVE